ncbi:MAG: hypothetical protein K2N57_03005 [Clostridia bacterium]|nr:hypothetical protein [Clostridia bacterium]
MLEGVKASNGKQSSSVPTPTVEQELEELYYQSSMFDDTNFPSPSPCSKRNKMIHDNIDVLLKNVLGTDKNGE